MSFNKMYALDFFSVVAGKKVIFVNLTLNCTLKCTAYYNAVAREPCTAPSEN